MPCTHLVHMLHRSIPFAICIAILVISGCSSPAQVESGRAGIIIQYPDGKITNSCVPFQGEEINGEDLLNRSGIEFIADVGNPMGSIICSIEGQGCNFPNEDCFCQCSEPGSCAYWSYFIKDDEGDWIYAPIGARMRKIGDGDLDAWIWVEGADFGPTQNSITLPEIKFEDICEG